VPSGFALVYGVNGFTRISGIMGADAGCGWVETSTFSGGRRWFIGLRANVFILSHKFLRFLSLWITSIYRPVYLLVARFIVVIQSSTSSIRQGADTNFQLATNDTITLMIYESSYKQIARGSCRRAHQLCHIPRPPRARPPRDGPPRAPPRPGRRASVRHREFMGKRREIEQMADLVGGYHCDLSQRTCDERAISKRMGTRRTSSYATSM
jgi:hypothetical protein